MTLYHTVLFIVLERKNGIWMAKCGWCERKRYCPTVARETEENHEELSNDRRYAGGIR
jgi:hypothetical protein